MSQNAFNLTGGYTTFKTGSIFKQAMKEEFIDMKQKVHSKIEENAKIVEDIRQKVIAWKAENQAGDTNARSFKMEKAVKMEDVQLTDVPEDQIIKRCKANLRTISHIIANIDLELPRLCNDSIFKKLLNQTKHYYKKMNSKNIESEVSLCNAYQSKCVRELCYDTLTEIISILVEAF